MNNVDLDFLIANAGEGDMDSLESIYIHTREPVYAYALSLLKNMTDAEDVLHDCYIKILHGASGYKTQGKPMAWIFTITRNLCLKKLNERKRSVDLTEEEWNDKLEGGYGLTTEESAVLKDLLEKLSEEEQKIITLHVTMGYKHREIAENMGIPISTVLSRYNRAIAKLKKM